MSVTGLLSSATNRASGGLITIQATPQCLEVEVAQDFGTNSTLRITAHMKWFGGTLIWYTIRRRNGYADKTGNGDLTIQWSRKARMAAVWCSSIRARSRTTIASSGMSVVPRPESLHLTTTAPYFRS